MHVHAHVRTDVQVHVHLYVHMHMHMHMCMCFWVVRDSASRNRAAVLATPTAYLYLAHLNDVGVAVRTWRGGGALDGVHLGLPHPAHLADDLDEVLDLEGSVRVRIGLGFGFRVRVWL